MYKLYIWYPWSFGRWIYKGEFTSLKALKEQIKNKRETTYKITKEDRVLEYHKAQSNCWRYGTIEPKAVVV